jgi:plastocyanin
MRKLWHIWFTALAIMTLAGCGQAPSNTSTIQEFTVAAKEFAFTPAALNVTAGQSVTIILQNTGTVEHDLSIGDIEISGEAKSSGETQRAHDGRHGRSAEVTRRRERQRQRNPHVHAEQAGHVRVLLHPRGT